MVAARMNATQPSCRPRAFSSCGSARHTGRSASLACIAAAVDRRAWLIATGLSIAVTTLPCKGEESGEWVVYENSKQRYSLRVPPTWVSKGKAGADALFEDGARSSTNVGVTVNPVRIATLQQFGSCEEVGARLLQAERNKDGFLAVAMVRQDSRVVGDDVLLYDYEYELNSTRGRKRILSTVSITNSKLYIVNASYKCEKASCDGGEQSAAIDVLRRIMSTVAIAPS